MTDPEGEGLADDLIGDDPIPGDAESFDESGHALPKPLIPLSPEPKKPS